MDALHAPRLVPHLFIDALTRDPERPALVTESGTWTRAELRDEVSRWSQAFAGAGIKRGTGIALLSGNRPEVVTTWGANFVTGSRMTTLSALASVADHCFILQDAEIDTLVLDVSLADRAGAYLDGAPGLRQVLLLGPADAASEAVRELASREVGAVRFLTTLAAAYEPKPLVAPEVGPDDVSSIPYTGGTTGRPKGVVGTYRSSAMLATIQLSDWEWPIRPVFLVATPLSHAGAAFVLPVLAQGGTVVVLDRFDPDAFLEAVERHRVTATFLVPTMIYRLLDHGPTETADLSSLEVLYYGAAKMDPARAQQVLDRLGPVLFQFYGQTECGMTITVLRRDEHVSGDPARLASCGRPVRWLDVRLLDPTTSEEVPVGEVGEICVRGPLVMRGYLNRPEETEQALRGDWLRTGDLARADADGFLTIVDRAKDMIVTGGFNVFPAEVEAVLVSHPEVLEAAVVGVPDPYWGEQVVAAIVRQPAVGHDAEAGPEAGAEVDAGREAPATVAAQLKEAVRDAKGPVAVPKHVVEVDALPLTALGKRDKVALRETLSRAVIGQAEPV